MSASVETGEVSVSGSGPGVSETYWGYIIQPSQDRFDRETVLEASMRFLGLILILAGYAQWLLPASFFSGDTFVMKAGLAFILGATGVAFYWCASQGRHVDVHVDTTRRELRVSHRNSRGQTRLNAVIPMRRVENAFIRRSETPGQPSSLCVRLRDRPELLQVAKGEVSELEPLHKRLVDDLRPAPDRVEARLARTVAFKTQRTV